MSKKKIERLSIVVSRECIEQLLGVPKLARGTGTNIAAAMYESAIQWNITINI